MIMILSSLIFMVGKSWILIANKCQLTTFSKEDYFIINVVHLVIFPENGVNIGNHFANIKHINVLTPVIIVVMSMVIWRPVSQYHSLLRYYQCLLQSILAKAFSSSSPSRWSLLSASCFLKYCINRELSSSISGLMYSSLIMDFRCLSKLWVKENASLINHLLSLLCHIYMNVLMLVSPQQRRPHVLRCSW